VKDSNVRVEEPSPKHYRLGRYGLTIHARYCKKLADAVWTKSLLTSTRSSRTGSLFYGKVPEIQIRPIP
jgi:hypothetical protein